MLPMALVAVKKHFAFLSLLIFFEDILFVVFTLLLFSPLSTISRMTCDLKVNQSHLWYSTRWEVCSWGSKEENLIHNFPLHSWKKKKKRKKRNPTPCYFYIIVAYDLYAFLVCGYCCAMLPVLSVLLDVTVIQERRKYPGRTYSILAGHAGGDFADGGILIQYNVMRHRSTALRGRGRLKSPVHMKSRICWAFFPLFFCFTARVVAPCSRACYPGRRGLCCSKGHCCPELGNY